MLLFLSFLFLIHKTTRKAFRDICSARFRCFNNRYPNTIITEIPETTFGAIGERYNYSEDIVLALMIECRQYFADEENLEKLLDMLSGNTFVTEGVLNSIVNDQKLQFPININDNIDLFHVHKEFTKESYYYGTSYFNYRSHINMILIGERDGTKIYSSLRQLNFYRWFFEYVYDHILENRTNQN